MADARPSLPPRLLARPERMRFALSDDSAGATPLELPHRNMVMAAVVAAAIFAVFAWILVSQIARLDLHALRSVSALMGLLFEIFWILGWSVGVAFLGALTVLLGFYRESARLAGGRLINVSRIGPFRMIFEYDLARMRNLRVEPDKSGMRARVRFDYGEGSPALGDTMPKFDAERLVAALRSAMPAAMIAPLTEAAAPSESAPPKIDPPAEAAPRPLPLGSVLALIAANLLPLAGVLFGGWKLQEVIVLFWAESAVIGFYTLLKMAVVGKWWALFAGAFFAGHFGGFMAIHFLFIYEMFVRGLHPRGSEPGAVEALTRLFTPLWPALLALFLSHGFSFGLNFLARREYRRATLSSLMVAPYRRVTLMQVTLIFGGWLVIALNNPVPALVLLIVLKVAADLYAHRGERGTRTKPGV
jgi:Family of unknown function (DUF6498)